jgi:hypothetical protein
MPFDFAQGTARCLSGAQGALGSIIADRVTGAPQALFLA